VHRSKLTGEEIGAHQIFAARLAALSGLIKVDRETHPVL
jgi:hypothetical protein